MHLPADWLEFRDLCADWLDSLDLAADWLSCQYLPTYCALCVLIGWVVCDC